MYSAAAAAAEVESDDQANCGAGYIFDGVIFGTHVGDMVGAIALATEIGAYAAGICKTIHPHPTPTESIGMAAEVAHWRCSDFPLVRK